VINLEIKMSYHSINSLGKFTLQEIVDVLIPSVFTRLTLWVRMWHFLEHRSSTCNITLKNQTAYSVPLYTVNYFKLDIKSLIHPSMLSQAALL
jgi:hypothetical protein